MSYQEENRTEYCPACGSALSFDTNVCPACGLDVEEYYLLYERSVRRTKRKLRIMQTIIGAFFIIMVIRLLINS